LIRKKPLLKKRRKNFFGVSAMGFGIASAHGPELKKEMLATIRRYSVISA
jgi:hypothetical protein